MDNGRSPRRRARARATRVSFVAAVVPALVVAQASREGESRSNDHVRQQIPTVWDAEALEEFELPPLGADFTVEHITPEYYYAIPERVIHKTYPVYHPDFEPPGYLDSLRTLEPQTVLDTDTLDSEADWIRAGELVFDSPQLFAAGFGEVDRQRPVYTFHRRSGIRPGQVPLFARAAPQPVRVR